MSWVMGSGRRGLGRGVAASLGALLAVGLAAVPAWALAPDAPAAPAALAGNAQIVVTFNAPAGDGGSMITAYTATCTSSNGGTTRSNANGGSVAPITVTGVTNGSTYACTVDATNGDGTSAESSPSNAVVPAGVPAAPAAPAAAAGDAALSLTFVAPDNNGSHITGYNATCTGGISQATASGPGSPLFVPGLTNGTAYTCTVDATNGAGTSAESPPSNAVTPTGVPGPPPAPAVALDETQITVAFGPPASNGGRPITGFTATCTGGATTASESGPGSPIVVGGLARGATYTCTVAATNSAGTGPSSPASAPVDLPATAPGKPARPTVERGNTKLTVSFTPSAANGSPISSYTVTCKGGFTPAKKSGAGSPIVLGGLKNGTRYTCAVTATNAIGTSPASSSSAPIAPAAVPDAPAQPTITRGVGKIVVKFARPASNGTAITRYIATCTSNNQGRPGSQAGPKSPITVGGLTNGRIYTCRVSAANAVGGSPRSAASASVVTGAAPAAPRIVSVVSGKAPGPTGPLLVSFKAGSNNGTPISSYRVRCVAVSDGSVHVNSSTGTPVTVPGLITGHAYTCSVVAISASGSSGSSGALTTKVGTPAMPRITSTTAHGHGLTMTFIVPSNNGNLILHYHAVCKSTNGGATAGQFARGSPFSVNALTPGGLYTCQLSAVNSRGEGPAATSSRVRVPF